MSYMKGLGTSAKGNDRLLKQYGGNAGSSPMARQHYASGGAVKSGNPSLDEGLSAAADGAPAKRSLARPGRKAAGKKKEAKTNINIVVAAKPDAPKPDMAMPMPPPGAVPPGPPPGPMPPMPMRANGGTVGKYARGGRIANLGKYAHGGKIKKAEGGTISEDSKREVARLRGEHKASKEASDIEGGQSGALMGLGAVPAMVSKGGLGKVIGGALMGVGASKLPGAFRAVGRQSVLRQEADRIERGLAKPGEEDRKHGGKVKRAEGGPAYGLKNDDGGSGGAKARLEKVKMYGK